MTENDLKKIKTLIGENFGITEAEITMEASLVKDLGADSLDIVELMMDIETGFQIAIPDEVVEKIYYVGDIVRYVDNYRAG